MNQAYGTSAEVCELMGYAYFTNTAAPAANTLVTQTATTVPAATAGQRLAQAYTLGPDARVPVVMNPTIAYHPAVAPGASTSVVMLDCRAFPADIIMAQGMYAPPPSATAGNLPAITSAGNCVLLAIDNVNKFIYFGFTNLSGTAQVPSNGSSLQFDVTFMDTYTV
jgi:hypothetical protein